ncbi:hypothetical protein H6F67_15915 [Microcoleus sp. FACHB-1515]|uniref:hypothetical protein n=1 Tax=Cyanophyceae TaxID=3028117 RepID=UPI001681D8AA|nr:hypothetical protein [Microcoleus sp. FACHB-1515]MBD2091333.1 hypothetical protein [Microcoleus sp. FACHB-1515]
MKHSKQNQSIVDYTPIDITENILLGGRDLVYLAGLQWNSIDDRSHHLLSYLAQTHRVFFIAEPVLEFISSWWLEIRRDECGVWVVVAHLPDWVSEALVSAMHHSLIDELIEKYAIDNPILWYCTPAALPFTRHVKSAAIVYDCVNERPDEATSSILQELEQQLLNQAHLVLFKERNLYKSTQHSNVYIFSNSGNQTWNEMNEFIEAAIANVQTADCSKDYCPISKQV